MFAHFTQETGGHNPHADEEEWRQVFKTVLQILEILLFVFIINCPKEYFIDAPTGSCLLARGWLY